MSGPFYKLERVHSLVHVIEGGRYVAHDECECVSCEGVLQKSGQLRLAECRDALAPSRQRVYHFPQRCQ